MRVLWLLHQVKPKAVIRQLHYEIETLCFSSVFVVVWVTLRDGVICIPLVFGVGVGADAPVVFPQETAPKETEISDANINKMLGAFSKVYTSNVPSAAFNSKTGRKYEDMKGGSSVVDLLKPHPSQGPSLGIQVIYMHVFVCLLACVRVCS